MRNSNKRGDSVPLHPEQIEEFDRLVKQYRQPIYRAAFRLMGNAEDAQDLVQETLLKAFRTFHQFEIGSHFDRWIFRIMHGVYADFLRKATKRQEVLSLDALGREEEALSPYELLTDRSTDPAWQLEQREFSEPVQRALDALPEEYRTVIILCDVEGFTYEEISELLHCPLGTVRSRLHRGRQLLREHLKHLRLLGGTINEP